MIKYVLVKSFDTVFAKEIENIIADKWSYNYGSVNGFGFSSASEFKAWKSDTVFMIAHDENQLVGFVALEKYGIARCSRFTPCLSCLWVHDQWRTQGIGKRLVTQLIEATKEELPTHKTDEVYLWLVDDSLVKWFESIGWRYLVKWPYLNRFVSIMYLNLHF